LSFDFRNFVILFKTTKTLLQLKKVLIEKSKFVFGIRKDWEMSKCKMQMENVKNEDVRHILHFDICTLHFELFFTTLRNCLHRFKRFIDFGCPDAFVPHQLLD